MDKDLSDSSNNPKKSNMMFVLQSKMTGKWYDYPLDIVAGQSFFDFTGTYYSGMIKTIIEFKESGELYPSVVLYDFVNEGVNRIIVDWNFRNLPPLPPPLQAYNANQTYCYAASDAAIYRTNSSNNMVKYMYKNRYVCKGNTVYCTRPRPQTITSQKNCFLLFPCFWCFWWGAPCAIISLPVIS